MGTGKSHNPGEPHVPGFSSACSLAGMLASSNKAPPAAAAAVVKNRRRDPDKGRLEFSLFTVVLLICKKPAGDWHQIREVSRGTSAGAGGSAPLKTWIEHQNPVKLDRPCSGPPRAPSVCSRLKSI